MTDKYKHSPELRLISHTAQRGPALARGILLRKQGELGPALKFEYSPEELSLFTLAMIGAGLGPDRNDALQASTLVDDIRDRDYLEHYGDTSLRARRYLGEKATLMLPDEQLLTVASPTFVSHVANHLRQDLVAPTDTLPPATEIRMKHIDGGWHGTIRHVAPRKNKS